MNLYTFELGRKKNLCFAELIAILGEKSLVERGFSTATFMLSSPATQKLQDKLGGIIKIVEIFDRIPSASQDLMKESIQKHLENNFKNRKGKIPFSISLLNFKNPRTINSKELLNFSKKILKSLGLNSRFVNKNFAQVKPSTIYKAKVVEKGVDINIIQEKEKNLIGKTITIQNIDAYSKRDFNKPRRDSKVGMLPPKLAQTMINLAGESKTIFDPFCGTGTVVMEGMLMGKTSIGSDIDPRMIEFSETNCKWLEKEFNTKAKYRIFKKDAQELTKEDIPEKIDAIITEGYLGKPVSNLPSPETRKKTFEELTELHSNWLKATHKILPKKGKIVMCKTAYRTPEGFEHFPDFEKIATEAGYKILGAYTYERPDQIVIRDIVILEK